LGGSTATGSSGGTTKSTVQPHEKTRGSEVKWSGKGAKKKKKERRKTFLVVLLLREPLALPQLLPGQVEFLLSREVPSQGGLGRKGTGLTVEGPQQPVLAAPL